MALFITILWSIVLFLVSSFAGLTSFRVRNHYQTAMIYLNAASTGVILAAAFTHLLPDAIEDLDQYKYPVGPAMALAGFLLMVLVETALQSRNLRADHKIAEIEHKNHNCEEHDNEFGADPVHNFVYAVPSSSFVKVQDKVEGKHQGCPTLEKQCSDNAKRRHSLTRTEDVDVIDPLSDGGEIQPFLNGEIACSAVEYSDVLFPRDHHHGRTSIKGRGSTSSNAAIISLWLALVMHSIMEGFGIGVTSNPLKQSTLVIAVLIHKGFASLALASALLESGMDNQKFTSFFLIFSLASPVGAVSACLVSTSGSSSIVSGIVTGLASGSFMYIGFMEMLPGMLSSCQHMMDAMALFVASAIAMAALAAIV